MAEEITRTRPAEFIEQAGKVYTNKLFGTTEAPGVLGQAVDTSQFAPSVAGLSALQKASMQAQATQAGLGTISYDPTTGLVSGVDDTGTGIGAFQPFLDESSSTEDVRNLINQILQDIDMGVGGMPTYQRNAEGVPVIISVSP